MRKIIIISLILLGPFIVSAQDKKDSACHFLENLSFKKGIDTIKVKAKFSSLFLSPDYPILEKLSRQKILNYDEFGVRTNESESSTAISFLPNDCTLLYNATISRKIPKNITDNLKEGQLIWLTCIVFNIDVGKHFHPNNSFEPYFLIIDVVKDNID